MSRGDAHIEIANYIRIVSEILDNNANICSLRESIVYEMTCTLLKEELMTREENREFETLDNDEPEYAKGRAWMKERIFYMMHAKHEGIRNHQHEKESKPSLDDTIFGLYRLDTEPKEGYHIFAT